MQHTVIQGVPFEKPDNESGPDEIFRSMQEPQEYRVEYYDEKAIEAFHALPKNALPALPWGVDLYPVNGKYRLFKNREAESHRFELVLYGPSNGKINYNILVDDQNIFSLCHPSAALAPGFKFDRKQRKYPPPIMTTRSGYKNPAGFTHLPGHACDHAYTIAPPGFTGADKTDDRCSTFNPKNYIPEPPKSYWGLYMRNALVGRLAAEGKAYSQYVEYAEDPVLTQCGAAVPDGVYFMEVDEQTTAPDKAYWIDFSTVYNKAGRNAYPSMIDYVKSYATADEVMPVALTWDVNQSKRAHRHAIRDLRKQGHDIRKGSLPTIDASRAALRTYCKAATLEKHDTYASISAALASSPSRPKQTKQILMKAAEQAEKLVALEDGRTPINKDRLKWMEDYNSENRPGFEDGLVERFRRLGS